MILRNIKIALSASVAAWGILAGLMNLLYYSHAPVAAVMSVGGTDSMRVISNPAIYALGYAFIYVGKFMTAGFAIAGTYTMWSNRNSEKFNAAKSSTVAACGVGIFMLFFGFYVIAASLFSTGSPSPLEDSYLAYALYQLGALGIIALYIAIPDPMESPKPQTAI